MHTPYGTTCTPPPAGPGRLECRTNRGQRNCDSKWFVFPDCLCTWKCSMLHPRSRRFVPYSADSGPIHIRSPICPYFPIFISSLDAIEAGIQFCKCHTYCHLERKKHKSASFLFLVIFLLFLDENENCWLSPPCPGSMLCSIKDTQLPYSETCLGFCSIIMSIRDL